MSTCRNKEVYTVSDTAAKLGANIVGKLVNRTNTSPLLWSNGLPEKLIPRVFPILFLIASLVFHPNLVLTSISYDLPLFLPRMTRCKLSLMKQTKYTPFNVIQFARPRTEIQFADVYKMSFERLHDVKSRRCFVFNSVLFWIDLYE